VDKLVPISLPYDEVLCECTECQSTWTVVADAAKDSKTIESDSFSFVTVLLAVVGKKGNASLLRV